MVWTEFNVCHPNCCDPLPFSRCVYCENTRQYVKHASARCGARKHQRASTALKTTAAAAAAAAIVARSPCAPDRQTDRRVATSTYGRRRNHTPTPIYSRSRPTTSTTITVTRALWFCILCPRCRGSIKRWRDPSVCLSVPGEGMSSCRTITSLLGRIAMHISTRCAVLLHM